MNVFKKILLFFKKYSHFGEKPENFLMEDISEDFFFNPDQRGSGLFLGKYTLAEIDLALKSFRIYTYLKKYGFYPVQIHLDSRDPFRQRLILYYKELRPSNILAELVVQKKILDFAVDFSNHFSLPFLSIEWLLLQNPSGQFTWEKPRLPGQNYPGLGIGKKILTALSLVCRDLQCAGLLNFPDYFHNAAMYARRFHFLSPVTEGLVKKLSKQLVQKFGLSTIAWAIERSCIYCNHKIFKWNAEPQIIAVDHRIKEYFFSDDYHTQVDEALSRFHFEFDENRFRQSLRQNPIPGFSEFWDANDFQK